MGILLMLAGSITPLAAQVHHVDRFSIDQGLLTAEITSVSCGPNGLIWLTSDGSGISSFDGRTFRHYNNTEVIGDLTFYSQILVGDTLFFGGEDLILRLVEDAFAFWEVDGIGKIRSMVHSGEQLLLLGSRSSRFYHHGDLTPLEIAIPNERFTDALRWLDQWWFTGGSGLWLYDDIWEHIDMSSGGCNHLTLIEGEIVYFDKDKGLVRRSKNHEVEILSTPGQMPSIDISFVREGGLAELVVGTRDRGLQFYHFLDSFWIGLAHPDLSYAHVTDITYDPWDQAWVSTMGGGAYRMSTQGYKIWPWSDLHGRYITSLDWCENGLLVKYRSGAADYIEDAGVEERAVAGVPILSDCGSGSRWKIYSRDIGYFSGTDPVIELDTLVGHLYPVRHAAASLDSSGVIIGTDQGLYKISTERGDSNTSFQLDTLLATPVSGLEVVRSGAVWYWYDHGIGLHGGERFGLDVSIHDVAPYGVDGLVLATDDGLYYCSQRGVQRVPGQQKISSRLRAVVGQYPRVWLASRDKLVQARFETNQALIVEKVYESGNAFPLLEILPQALAVRSRDHLYVGTSSGVLELVPKGSDNAIHGPKLSLLSGQLGDQEFEGVPQVDLVASPSGSSLVLSLLGVDQGAPNDIVYWHSINAGEWMPSGPSGQIYFNSFSPGHYNISLKATNINQEDSNVLQLQLKVVQPLWSRWWFVVGVLVMLFAFVYVWHRYRLKKKLRIEMDRSAMLAQENKILQLEQTAKQLQMNPHFIFNALQSVQHSIASNERDQARKDLQAFSKLMRRMLNYVREDRVMLEVEIELLRSYLSIESKLRRGRFEYAIDIDGEVDPSLVSIPPMFVQPLVENAIKHGLPREGLGMIRIIIGWKGRFLQIAVEDNGPGISIEEERPASVGLRNVQERLLALHGDNNVKVLDVSPMVDDNGEVEGTRAGILLPV